MSYRAKYGALLDDIANEADAMAMSYFRGGALGTERKRDGTVVTQADKRIEQMAIAKVQASGLPIDVVGEETSTEPPKGPATNGRARMIIDPIDGTEEFTRGIPTFGTLIGIEEDAYLRPLTQRDMEILRLLADGKSLSQIAEALGVAYKTVANTLSRIKDKLGVSQTADLIRIAIGQGIT